MLGGICNDGSNRLVALVLVRHLAHTAINVSMAPTSRPPRMAREMALGHPDCAQQKNLTWETG